MDSSCACGHAEDLFPVQTCCGWIDQTLLASQQGPRCQQRTGSKAWFEAPFGSFLHHRLPRLTRQVRTLMKASARFDTLEQTSACRRAPGPFRETRQGGCGMGATRRAHLFS
eukprot:jgi/Botrbrau1/8535/Bobra.0029s0038.1